MDNAVKRLWLFVSQTEETSTGTRRTERNVEIILDDFSSAFRRLQFATFYCKRVRASCEFDNVVLHAVNRFVTSAVQFFVDGPKVEGRGKLNTHATLSRKLTSSFAPEETRMKQYWKAATLLYLIPFASSLSTQSSSPFPSSRDGTRRTRISAPTNPLDINTNPTRERRTGGESRNYLNVEDTRQS